MVIICCVTGCRTGYQYQKMGSGSVKKKKSVDEQISQTETSPISKYSFPRDPELRQRWAEKVGKGPDWMPSKTTKICGLHFKKSQFTLVREDKNSGRAKKLGEIRVRPKLRPDAVPLFFGPNVIKEREEAENEDERLEKEAAEVLAAVCFYTYG